MPLRQTPKLRQTSIWGIWGLRWFFPSGLKMLKGLLHPEPRGRSRLSRYVLPTRNRTGGGISRPPTPRQWSKRVELTSSFCPEDHPVAPTTGLWLIQSERGSKASKTKGPLSHRKSQQKRSRPRQQSLKTPTAVCGCLGLRTCPLFVGDPVMPGV